MSDPTTQSNYLQIATQHVHLDWLVDFSKKTISGFVELTLRARENGVDRVILDSMGLNIDNVDVEGKPATYSLGERHEVLGSALQIHLPSAISSGTEVHVKVTYAAGEDSTALQWLEKEQTQGKVFPFLFSQCQSIYARAVAPLQDTSSLKITYSASVTSTLPILMSAIRASPPSIGPPHDGKVIGKDLVVYKYNQPIAIPSYLIAIASGNVRYRAFPQIPGKTWTSGVWAEPETLEAAYWEFSRDTTKFLAAEEDLIAPYAFGVYDLLVLPPSFPYGGMENPCLSFLTPSLLAGDRTLVDVVIHELTHSFFGNGVTNVHASHFWLNEGWTTYTERLMLQVIYSPAERGFSYLIGYKALVDSLRLYEKQPKYQRLRIDFEKGDHPDEAYSRVPYEKGSNLLLHLERVLGGLAVFLPYIKDYVNTFMGKSISTEDWKSHLYAYFEAHGGEEKIKALDGVDWNGWFYGEGLSLPVVMEYDMTLADQAYELAQRWDNSRTITDLSQLDFSENDLTAFNANQIIAFLDRLQFYGALPSEHISHLSALYKLSETSNGEIRFRFYEVALADPLSTASKTFAPHAAKWVVGHDGSGIIKGRMKFCRPVFRAIAKVDKALAERTFGKSKDAFHPIARKLIETDLAVARGSSSEL